MSPVATRKPVFRQVRSVPLVYGEVVECELPERCTILGIHAQPEGGEDENGNARRRYVRTVEPQLKYLFEADRKLVTMRILLLRGDAELPLDPDHRYDFLGSTVDKNTRHSGFASAWLVSEVKQGSTVQTR